MLIFSTNLSSIKDATDAIPITPIRDTTVAETPKYAAKGIITKAKTPIAKDAAKPLNTQDSTSSSNGLQLPV
ncbi:hypothetical protein EAM01S_06_01950 [Erwinia amylovora NBRC 12687 = CFBP 1232]|nr:hypothetical protein EAM01S_06_01950 [Erwinia amylovora NBRC 12687 = CFBP 1232]